MLPKCLALLLLILGPLTTSIHSQDLGIPDTIRCGWSYPVTYPDSFSIPIYIMTDDSLAAVGIVLCYLPDSFQLTSVTAGPLIENDLASSFTVTVDNQDSHPSVELYWVGSDVKLSAPLGGLLATLNFRQFPSLPFDCHITIDTCSRFPGGTTEFVVDGRSPYKPVCPFPVEITCVDVNDEPSNPPGTNSYAMNTFPNPFNSGTTFELDVPSSEHLSIVIYDILGRHVRTIVDEFVSRGTHQFAWDGNNESGRSVSSGVYFAQVIRTKMRAVQKLVLLR